MPVREIPPRMIGLMLNPATEFGRSVHRGITDWLRHHPDWTTLLVDRGALIYFRERGLRFAGLIGRVDTADSHALAYETAHQVVSVTGQQWPDPNLCIVTNDNRAIGRLAAQYFIERGWTRLRFVSGNQYYFQHERWAGIQETAHAANLEPEISHWEHRDGCVALLRSLPALTAAIAEHDFTALTLVREARTLGIAVPTDLAVMGIDDDDFLVESEMVPISSIRPAYRAIAWQAAELIRTHGAKPGTLIQIPPEGVVERKSSQAFAVADERIRRVLNSLQSGFSDPVNLARVARDAGMSRRNMDLLFQHLLKTTPGRWLRRLRLREAKRLLTGTQLSVEDVATRCGFGNAVAFWKTIKEETGLAPGQYRQNFRRLAR